uniref:Uncharacterized protein n=1 Tax=Glossina austeni TaxID=7395 RepID=A0A1A9VAC7_GLOAU
MEEPVGVQTIAAKSTQLSTLDQKLWLGRIDFSNDYVSETAPEEEKHEFLSFANIYGVAGRSICGGSGGRQLLLLPVLFILHIGAFHPSGAFQHSTGSITGDEYELMVVVVMFKAERHKGMKGRKESRKEGRKEGMLGGLAACLHGWLAGWLADAWLAKPG